MHSRRLLSLALSLELNGEDEEKRGLIVERLRALAGELFAAEAVAVPPHLRLVLDRSEGVVSLEARRSAAR